MGILGGTTEVRPGPPAPPPEVPSFLKIRTSAIFVLPLVFLLWGCEGKVRDVWELVPTDDTAVESPSPGAAPRLPEPIEPGEPVPATDQEAEGDQKSVSAPEPPEPPESEDPEAVPPPPIVAARPRNLPPAVGRLFRRGFLGQSGSSAATSHPPEPQHAPPAGSVDPADVSPVSAPAAVPAPAAPVSAPAPTPASEPPCDTKTVNFQRIRSSPADENAKIDPLIGFTMDSDRSSLTFSKDPNIHPTLPSGELPHDNSLSANVYVGYPDNASYTGSREKREWVDLTLRFCRNAEGECSGFPLLKLEPQDPVCPDPANWQQCRRLYTKKDHFDPQALDIARYPRYQLLFSRNDKAVSRQRCGSDAECTGDHPLCEKLHRCSKRVKFEDYIRYDRRGNRTSHYTSCRTDADCNFLNQRFADSGSLGIARCSLYGSDKFCSLELILNDHFCSDAAEDRGESDCPEGYSCHDMNRCVGMGREEATLEAKTPSCLSND